MCVSLIIPFQTGQDIINSGAWPKWNEGTEFKGARDEMMDSSE